MGLTLQILFCSTTEDKKNEPNNKMIYTYTEPVISDLSKNPTIYSYTTPIYNKN